VRRIAIDVGPNSGTSSHKRRTPAFAGGSGVEAPGIEADQSQAPDTIEQQSSTIEVRAVSADVPDRAPKCAIVRRDVTESSEAYELSNVVETALAKALVFAAEAKRWEIVVLIAEELRRRL
jgi:hypothetical protein